MKYCFLQRFGKCGTLCMCVPLPLKLTVSYFGVESCLFSSCFLAAAYYPATQQYPTSVSATPVMMNPAQQQPPPPPQQAPPQQSGPVKQRERKQVGGNSIWCVFILNDFFVTY